MARQPGFYDTLRDTQRDALVEAPVPKDVEIGPIDSPAQQASAEARVTSPPPAPPTANAPIETAPATATVRQQTVRPPSVEDNPYWDMVSAQRSAQQRATARNAELNATREATAVRVTEPQATPLASDKSNTVAPSDDNRVAARSLGVPGVTHDYTPLQLERAAQLAKSASESEGARALSESLISLRLNGGLEGIRKLPRSFVLSNLQN